MKKRTGEKNESQQQRAVKDAGSSGSAPFHSEQTRQAKARSGA